MSNGEQSSYRKVKRDRMVPLAALSRPEKFETNICDPLHRWAAQRSFVLFIAPDARSQKHWVPVSLGWLRHSGYKTRFYSEYFYWEYVKDNARKEIDAYHREMETSKVDSALDASISSSRISGIFQKFSNAEKNAQNADPTVWKEDPDLSGCD